MRGRRHRGRRRASGGSLTRLRACLLALLVAVAAAEAKKVRVGEQRFHVVQKGKESPTVVFDSGLGDTSETWRWVWPDVAKSTRVFLYDRAGLGRSDPGPLPRTSQQIVSELHFLLEAAGESPPYVLVGHSFGGLNLRLFASQYPDEVAALILIDATPLEFPEREPELRTELERTKLETLSALGPEAMRQERGSIRESAMQVRGTVLPDVPVLVISSTRADESPEFREAWSELQEALAARVRASRHIVTEKSGHYIQFDEPELLVRLIVEVAAAAR